MPRRSAADSRSPASLTGVLLVGASAVALLALLRCAPAAATDAGALTPAERAAVLALGPWPPPAIRDPANPASGNPAGIALGEALFYSPRLSPTGLRCASCHEPWRHFADGRVVAQGVATMAGTARAASSGSRACDRWRTRARCPPVPRRSPP